MVGISIERGLSQNPKQSKVGKKNKNKENPNKTPTKRETTIQIAKNKYTKREMKKKENCVIF